MEYRVEQCDVTSKLPEYVSAHCISYDCAMGSGVVVAYNRLVPTLKKECIRYIEYAQYNKMCRNERNRVMPYIHSSSKGRIYNMFTKEKYWHKAGKGMTSEEYLLNLKESLEFIRNDMVTLGLTKIAMPKIASKRDGCQWTHVENMIKEIFNDTSIEVLICEYEERG